MDNIEEKKEDFKSKVDEVLNIEKFREALKNNQLAFVINDVKYRVSGLTYDQREKVHRKRIEKYYQLLDDPFYLLEEDLVQKYKKNKGIDIEEITNKIRVLFSEKETLEEKLGKELTEESPSDSSCDLYKTEILKIDDEITRLSKKKTDLLDYSIENQSAIYAFGYLMFLITEKEIEPDKWAKVWNTYEDFANEKETLVNKIALYASIVGSNELMEQ